MLYAGLDNNGEYDCINRADEEREKRNSFVDFKTIISCYNEVYGYRGLMCGEDCLPYHEWCRQGTSQSCNSIFTTCVANSTWCRQDNSRFTTNNTNLCRSNFWIGHDCLTYYNGIIIGFGERCTKRSKHCQACTKTSYILCNRDKEPHCIHPDLVCDGVRTCDLGEDEELTTECIDKLVRLGDIDEAATLLCKSIQDPG